MIDVKATQRTVGVKDDGIWGPGSWAALLMKCGCPSATAGLLAFPLAWSPLAVGLLDNSLRTTHFLAQLGHESDGFRAMEEYASGKAYEGRDDLGNTQPGDGVRYKGRGPIQVTGRNNYRIYGRIIGINVEANPILASDPGIGMLLSLAYWQKKGLSELADKDDILTITKRINGGTNGLADRKARLAVAKRLVK